MTDKELRNLQIYIGKRSLGQTDVEVIEHIEKINNKTPLSQEEWNKLLIPCCNGGMVTILRYVLGQIEILSGLSDLMRHTVYVRQLDLECNRIETLRILMEYLDDNRQECLNETMIHAAWFGEVKIVKYLIDQGANRTYQNASGLSLDACAERVSEVFQDNTLKEYLQHK